MKEDYSINGDSHMIKNMEWGAVAYLKQSKYGLGEIDIQINNSSGYYTGGGENISYKTNINQSTTGNIYGIYDMSGGAYERVMGNMVDINSNFYSSASDFDNNLDSKYYDKYSYSTSSVTHIRGRLGDATKETLTTFGNTSGGWYGDYANTVSSNYSWFSRGGSYSYVTSAGVFNFDKTTGYTAEYSTSRAILS